MASRYIIGNWKMYPTLSDSLVLAASLKNQLEDIKGVHVVIAPTQAWLPSIAEAWTHRSSTVSLAAQNVWPEDQGAYTGEVSAYFLKDMINYALIGHSERRRMGESNELVREKVQACLRWRIKPIICIGEQKRVFDSAGRIDSYQWEKLSTQLMEALYGVKDDQLSRILIAYEPVWAIGTHRPAEPDYVEKVVEKLRERLSEKYSKTDIEHLPMLYGGSANASTAADYLRLESVNGLLLGEVSVKATEFIKICQLAAARR